MDKKFEPKNVSQNLLQSGKEGLDSSRRINEIYNHHPFRSLICLM